MSEDGVTLHARSLLSKWGFGDGDEPDHYLDWLEENGHPWPRDGGDPDWHLVLRHLVRTRLLPLIKEDVVLYDIETIHNPIRAESVNGAAVDDYDTENDHMLADVSVTVPYAEVYEVQRQLAEKAEEPPATTP